MELFFLLKAHRKQDDTVSHRPLALGPSAPRQDPCVRSRGRMESLGLPAVTLGDGTTAHLQQAGRGNSAARAESLFLALKFKSGSPNVSLTAWELPNMHGHFARAAGGCWICAEV